MNTLRKNNFSLYSFLHNKIVLSAFVFCIIRISSAGTLNIAVATNFQPVLSVAADSFFQSTGNKILISSASTGNLYSQILNGAPFDIFMAADTMSIFNLKIKKKIIPESVQTYACGVLIAVSASPPASNSLPEALNLAATIAIAQPSVAPYGKAAHEVLKNLNLLDSITRKLVFARSIGQSFHYAHTGNVSIAFVALSSIKTSSSTLPGIWPVDPSLYNRIEQRMAIIATTKNQKTAADFHNYMLSPAMRECSVSFGYTLPEIL